ncbi:hypothetical protein SCLO_1003510 [Sphingobium cloacae]|uniref:Uncharacterized protein n=2 Tax=Sphingobium cloacae TaxID=120107 RepID=A0A1E1EYT2_9SPHN|nr:hypothetical protein SCLO_1003510 [Sphingobium cloacae]
MRSDAIRWLMLLREEPEDEALAAEFEAWRKADPAHAAAWDSANETFAAIGDTPPAYSHYWRESAAPPIAVSRPGAGRRWTRALRRRPVAWVAGLAAACIALMAAPDIDLRLRADHLTGAGRIDSVALADGSRVALGPDSAIQVAYSGNARAVRLLAGQAWFEVAPDARRPFTVRARDITTTVLGTGFDVRMIGGRTSVSVGHGRVEVRDDGVVPARARTLDAGQWVRIGEDKAIVSGAGRVDLAGGWRKGEVQVIDRTIAEVIDEIRPWYSGKIVLANRALGKQRVTGVYKIGDPGAALQALVTPHGGSVRRVTPWLLIVSGA